MGHSVCLLPAHNHLSELTTSTSVHLPEQTTSASCWKSQPLRRLLLSLQFLMVVSVPLHVMYFPPAPTSWRGACSTEPQPSSLQNTVASSTCRPQSRSTLFSFLISGSPAHGLRPFTSRISRKVPSAEVTSQRHKTPMALSPGLVTCLQGQALSLGLRCLPGHPKPCEPAQDLA